MKIKIYQSEFEDKVMQKELDNREQLVILLEKCLSSALDGRLIVSTGEFYTSKTISQLELTDLELFEALLIKTKKRNPQPINHLSDHFTDPSSFKEIAVELTSISQKIENQKICSEIMRRHLNYCKDQISEQNQVLDGYLKSYKSHKNFADSGKINVELIKSQIKELENIYDVKNFHSYFDVNLILKSTEEFMQEYERLMNDKDKLVFDKNSDSMIESGINALGGQEKESIRQIKDALKGAEINPSLIKNNELKASHYDSILKKVKVKYSTNKKTLENMIDESKVLVDLLKKLKKGIQNLKKKYCASSIVGNLIENSQIIRDEFDRRFIFDKYYESLINLLEGIIMPHETQRRKL